MDRHERLRAIFERVLSGPGEDALVAEHVHEDFVNHEAVDERKHGPEGFAATVGFLRSCFGDMRWDLHEVVVDGEVGMVHGTLHGTHEGGLPPGAPATHKPFSVRHVHIFRFADDGRILEHRAVRDDLGMARQIGLLGRP